MVRAATAPPYTAPRPRGMTQAGYTNVCVMREGIKGCNRAGKKTIERSAPAAEDKQES